MPHPHSHRTGHPYGKPFGARPNLDFDRAPFIVVRETAQACDLACRHCRASAQPLCNPNELTTAEEMELLDDVRKFGRVMLVFSDGDAPKRPDIIDLMRHDAEIGLRMVITPAAASLASREQLQALKDAGLSRLAVNLNGSSTTIRDESHRVKGSFAHGLHILREAQEISLTTQVNTVVRRVNLDDMETTCRLMTELGIVFWEVFFLVPMGQARKEDVASAEGFEAVFNQLYDLSKTAFLDIKATAAPQYSRVVMQRKRAGVRVEMDIGLDVLTSGMHYSQQDGTGRARNVNDGDGFTFISHVGDIYSLGFLSIKAGNTRTDDIEGVYRYSLLFTMLRDRSQLKDKCGIYSYRFFCGGSWARAYAMTGDYLVEEPFCVHEPHRLQKPLPSHKDAG